MARRSARQNVQFAAFKTSAFQHRFYAKFTDVYYFARCGGKIPVVGFYCVGVNVRRKTNVITGLLKSEGATACTRKQTNRGWRVKFGISPVKSVNHNDGILSCLRQRVND